MGVGKVSPESEAGVPQEMGGFGLTIGQHWETHGVGGAAQVVGGAAHGVGPWGGGAIHVDG